MQDKTENPKTWWQTLPGILTAVSGVIVALSGLIGVLIQAGLAGPDGTEALVAQDTLPPPVVAVPRKSPEPASTTPVVQAVARDAESSEGPPGRSTPAAPVVDPKPMKESEAVFTTIRGETARVDAASLFLGYDRDDKTLPLTSGQFVDFDKMRGLEVLSVTHTDRYKRYPDDAGELTVRIQLLNGQTITGTVALPDGGLQYFFFSATGSLGDFRIRPWEVSAIRFER
jgi:hypothetical protein